MTTPTASFGFREVPEAEKEGLVREVFSSVARNYDVMNDLMSGGVHRLWKDAMVEWLNPQPGQAFLDVAGGTGDIAFRIADLARARGGEAAITVCDINAQMLNEGVRRAGEMGEGAITWVCGDAEKLPIPDQSVDAYTIAFGIRNVTHIDRALAEARRVLKPADVSSVSNSRAWKRRGSMRSTNAIPFRSCRRSANGWRRTATPIAISPKASAVSRRRDRSPR